MERGADSFVVIGNREIYDAVMQLKAEVAAIKPLAHEQEAQAKRIGRLEFRYYAILAGLVGTLASVGVAAGMGGGL